MPYIFSDFLSPPSGVKRALISQDDVKGSLLVISKLTDIDKIKRGAVKRGMLVSVSSEKGALYECSNIEVSYDEDDNEILVPVFRPFYTPTDNSGGVEDNEFFKYQRPTKTINFSYIKEGAVVNIPINMECKSFIITNVEVTKDRMILFKVFSTLLRKDLTPYEFNSSRQNYDSGMTKLAGGQNFQYRKFFTCVNQEAAKENQTKFVFQCTSLEKGSYTTSKGLTWNEVEVKITYIPLEA